jgi:translation initiation factor IF-3
LPIRDALNLARERELDLVEIAPTAQPPVCRIMNLGKFMYEASKKAQKARKKQKTIQVKEVKFRPKIDEHDYQFKKKHIERFMEDGHKVKAVIMFRGRELAHPEIGRRILERLMEELKDIIDIERPPRQEGNNMIAIFTAKRT